MLGYRLHIFPFRPVRILSPTIQVSIVSNLSISRLLFNFPRIFRLDKGSADEGIPGLVLSRMVFAMFAFPVLLLPLLVLFLGGLRGHCTAALWDEATNSPCEVDKVGHRKILKVVNVVFLGIIMELVFERTRVWLVVSIVRSFALVLALIPFLCIYVFV